jgi:predicted NBD/HSP70 family sugar kinase
MSGDASFLRSHYSISESVIKKRVDSRVRGLAQGDLNQISIEVIGQAAIENDSFSFRFLHEAGSRIAAAMADVVNLLNPHFLIFRGALFHSAPDLFL